MESTINDLIDTLERLPERDKNKPLVLLDVDFYEHVIADIECSVDDAEVMVGLFPRIHGTRARHIFPGFKYFPYRKNLLKLKKK